MNARTGRMVLRRVDAVVGSTTFGGAGRRGVALPPGQCGQASNRSGPWPTPANAPVQVALASEIVCPSTTHPGPTMAGHAAVGT